MVRGLALLLSGLSLASAQTYTVTETVDACPASYSNAPSTVTVQSSVTVTPTPLTDANLNAGTPFVIQVAQYSAPGALSARAAPVYSWLTTNGSLTNSNSSATQYHIAGGRLYTSSGLCVSANTSTGQTILAASPLCGPFSGNFSFENDMLNWTNSAFFDGAAQFFAEYNATSNTTQVAAMLNGLLSAEQLANRLVLYGRTAVPSTSASSTVGQSSSISSYAQPSASASLASTPNGICGGNSGYTCAGASFGTCCSAYGYCGSSADYCGTGCQTGFGACGVPGQSVSSSSTGSMSAPGAMSSMPIYANTSRASSSSTSTHLGPGPAYPDSSSMTSSVTSSLGLPAYTPPASSSTTTSSSFQAPYSPIGSSSTSTSSVSSSTTTTSLPGAGGYFSAPTSSSTSTSSTTHSSSTSSSTTSSAMGAYTSSTTTSSSPSMASTTTSQTTTSSMTISSMTTSSMTMSSMTTSSMTTSSMTTTSMTTTSSPTTSASPSAYTPATNYVSTPASCPADNNTVVQDSDGIQYAIMCGGDTFPGSYTSVVAASSFNDCFDPCDADSQCMSWTYSGGPNGNLGGTCYFKTAATTMSYRDVNHIAANRLTPRAASSASASSSASSSVVSSTTSSTTSSMVAPSSSISSTSSSMTTSSSSSAAVSSSTSSSTPLISVHIGPNTSAASTTSSASSTTSAPSQASAGYTSTPTPCINFGDAPGTDEDDAFCEIDLPFNISMYNGRGNTNQTFVSTNGLLTLYAGTDAYSSDGLPDNDQLGNYAIVPFWDDLFYYASEGDGEGIYYEINEAQTTVNYTFVLSRAGSNFELWEFGVYYDSTVPGVFTFVYNKIDDQGATATVGIQGLDDNNIPIGTTYSNSQPDIAPAPGLEVVCDSNTGVCTGNNGQTATQTYVPSG